MNGIRLVYRLVVCNLSHDYCAARHPHRDLTALVNLGANLGLTIGSCYALEPAPIERYLPAMLWLGITDEDLDAVAAQCLDARFSYRINTFCIVAFLTAASGMPASKVTSLASC
jgi:hypothetical protein